MSIRRTLLLVVSALVSSGCSDTSGPPGASLRIEGPGRLSDTVTAVFGRVEARVYGDHGEPDVSYMLVLYAHGGLLVNDPSSPTQEWRTSISTDGDRVGAYFVASHEAGPASVRAVYGELEDTVHFEVLPGALARLIPTPADTALGVGRQFPIGISAADRFGNLRGDIISTPVLRSLRTDVAVVNGGIVTTLAHGRTTIELEALGIVESTHITVTPAGMLAVFDTVQTGAAPGVLLDVGDGVVSALADLDRADCPAWHPDGVRLLLRGMRLTVPASGTVDLLPADAGLDAQCGVFTPDGEWVFFEVQRPAGVSQIWRIRADGSALEQLTDDEDEIDAYSPSPSPDGARFAYVLRYRDRVFDSQFIAVRDVATGTVDTITGPVDTYQLFGQRQSTALWSPDGEWIAYTTPTHPALLDRSWSWGRQVHLVRPDGSGSRVITLSGGAFANFYPDRMSWSADGRWLAAKRHRSDLRLALIDVATGEVLPLNLATRAYMAPVWRP